MTRKDEALLSVRHLVKHFPIRAGIFKRIVAWVKAVDGVDFDIYEGETLGLVGESGCGKTTIGMTLLGLYPPTGGSVYFNGEDITPYLLPRWKVRSYLKQTYVNHFKKLSGDEIEKLPQEVRRYAEVYFNDHKGNTESFVRHFTENRKEKQKAIRREMQIVFQDPYSSLNPRMRIGNIIGEAVDVHGLASSSAERRRMVAEILQKVGLYPEYAMRYPHEFSGGQRQRIGIARALILNPKLVVADEAVSALDVSIRSQILNLMEDLQREFQLTYLFISHDLSVIKHISDRVAVMYLGKIVEVAPKKKLFDRPLHPYTVSLMSAIPIPDPDYKKRRVILKGDVPSPINPPSGCRFHPRCPIAREVCSKEEPPLKEVEEDRKVACFFAGEIS
ncbi:MAG: ABC transporter ATP-binding protein [Thermotogae bacterium]|nr:MAG: ABC transporter ATP-binding protein [Thermotogota bacterium]